MNYLNSGDNVLFIWKDCEPNVLKNFIKDIQEKIGQTGFAILENAENVRENGRPHSSFDLVVSNWLPPHTVEHTDNVFASAIKFLKPSGKIVLRDYRDMNSILKLNGFINVVQVDDVFVAEKPNFEVGSRAQLKLKSPVWKIDDTMEAAWTTGDDDDTIDSDQLLDENDLQRPDQLSLRVCATSGKRKACADCSCGLAEELRGDTKQTPKSSCGSCYLGDAFRCATCPYLGMPAFKPGEKVVLDLNSDI